MSEESRNQNSIKLSSQGSSNGWIDNEVKALNFDLMMAEEVWMKVKGYPIPDCYSEKDRLEIFERYYHRAVSQSQGE